MDLNFFNHIFLGNPIKQYLISLGIFIGVLIIGKVVNKFLKTYAARLTKKTATKLDDIIVKNLLQPLVYLFMVIGFYFAKENLKLNPKLTLWLNKALITTIFVILFVMTTRFFQELIDVVGDEYLKKIKQKHPETLREQTQRIKQLKKQVREITLTVLMVIFLLTLLSNLGLNLKAIWTSLGIGGIALVVAVKEPLTNIVGRLYIFGTGLFDEGHFIVFKEWAGTVKKIGFFRTYLELFSDMTTVSIPNAEFVKNPVKNYFGRTKFIYKWDLDLPYDTTPQKIKTLIEKLKDLILSKPEVNPDMTWIYLDRLDKYSKVVRVWFQAHLPNWPRSLYYGSEVLGEIQNLFSELQLEFAFPTQTVELKNGTVVQRKTDLDVLLPEVDLKESKQ